MDIKLKKSVEKIAPLLARKLKITGESLCFCGNGQLYEDCCEKKTYKELYFLEDLFEELQRIKEARGSLEDIPPGKWKTLQDASIDRLPCLFNGCNRVTCGGHLIPDNILKSSFGTECLTRKISHFEKVRTKSALAEDVFCPIHDDSIFKDIDTLEIDFSNKEHEFLLAFKAISFSLRHVQGLLGIQSQIELMRPLFIINEMEKNGKVEEGTNFDINLNQLVEQYSRFVTHYNVYQEAFEAYKKKDWGYFTFFSRSIDYSGKGIFFGGFVNPSHDLGEKKLNKATTAINMTCNVYTKDGKLNILFACPGKESQIAYADFLDQLGGITDQKMINVINNLMSLCPDKLILRPDFDWNEKKTRKLQRLRDKAQKCLVGNGTFYLLDDDRCVKFIEI